MTVFYSIKKRCKLIFLLQDNHRKEMASIEATDAQFAIKNKDRIRSILICLKKFLTCSELYEYYKEGNRSFIPLFFVCYHLFHKQIANADIEKFFDNYDTGNTEYPKIYKWVYYSLINGVFKSKRGWLDTIQNRYSENFRENQRIQK